MKTPRDILLEQHRDAESKLDVIRQSAVAAVCDRRSGTVRNERRSQTAATIWQAIWRELIFPSRRIWAGLATVWALIFIINFSQRDHSQITMAKSSPSPEMIVAYRQQEKLLAELIGQTEPQVAEPPKTFLPRPSSQRQFEILIT